MSDTHDTPESFDGLESELTALRPVAPPAALKQRIGAELDDAPAPSQIRFWPIAAAVAACLGAVMLLIVYSPTATDPPPLVFTGPVDTTRPTHNSYRHVLNKSPELLDDLLDQHARTVLPPSEPLDLAGLY